ncbi:hypothetical protein [Vibrio coralliilyticus]|uniref:hypothetical protein n=1 Tax=Vibrio coralliilyticus TaxID=190893 RepID=UPI001E5A3622|nr:hypothetical protein [Vibrio coralliilyticus]MCC2525322.1 hypothetical protein [Vibrio coralliilyticus]
MKIANITLMLIGLSLSFNTYAKEYRGQIQSLGTGALYGERCEFDSCAVIMVKDSHVGTCGPDSWDFVIRTDTESGKATLSQALTAYTTGKEVVIGGTGKCDLMSTVESLKYIYFKFK